MGVKNINNGSEEIEKTSVMTVSVTDAQLSNQNCGHTGQTG